MKSLRSQAESIWWAGVKAVDPVELIDQQISSSDDSLDIGPVCIPFSGDGRIEVLGAGKAGAAMAQGFEAAVLRTGFPSHRLSGSVNVPAQTELPALQRIGLHVARPHGINEPTSAGVEGTREILRRAASLRHQDLCVVLLSGGGSALLPAPCVGISLADKVAVTRHLSRAGADIQELNRVRSQLSDIKGGGLARHCRAGQLLSFVVSDVLGDPLETIASGPCVMPAVSPAAGAIVALEILQRYDPQQTLPPAIYKLLRSRASDFEVPKSSLDVFHEIIGNNAVAVDQAGIEADELGWHPAMYAAKEPEGSAEAVGRQLVEMAIRMLDNPIPDCLISGGEPTVVVPTNGGGKGGRNQQLILSAMCELFRAGLPPSELERICILSAGTDGEDGPTDAAGAICTWETLQRTNLSEVSDHLQRCDAYPLLEKIGGLFCTGPSGTNVCDLRVVLVAGRHDQRPAFPAR